VEILTFAPQPKAVNELFERHQKLKIFLAMLLAAP
jgi:hypothetical protein